MTEPHHKKNPGLLSEDFYRGARPAFTSQDQANHYFKTLRASILERHACEHTRLSNAYVEAQHRMHREVLEKFRPHHIELNRVHGHEQRFAASKSTGPIDRAIFLAKHRQRFIRHKLFSPREMARMTYSPAHFARALGALHRAERSHMEREESAFRKIQDNRLHQEYARKFQMQDDRAFTEVDREEDRFFVYSPDKKAASEFYYSRFEAQGPATKAVPQPAADKREPIRDFDGAKGNIFNFFGRAEQIKLDMQIWLKDQPQRERDDGRER